MVGVVGSVVPIRGGEEGEGGSRGGRSHANTGWIGSNSNCGSSSTSTGDVGVQRGFTNPESPTAGCGSVGVTNPVGFPYKMAIPLGLLNFHLLLLHEVSRSSGGGGWGIMITMMTRVVDAEVSGSVPPSEIDILHISWGCGR